MKSDFSRTADRLKKEMSEHIRDDIRLIEGINSATRGCMTEDFKEKEGHFPDSDLNKLKSLAEGVNFNMVKYKDRTSERVVRAAAEIADLGDNIDANSLGFALYRGVKNMSNSKVIKNPITNTVLVKM